MLQIKDIEEIEKYYEEKQVSTCIKTVLIEKAPFFVVYGSPKNGFYRARYFTNKDKEQFLDSLNNTLKEKFLEKKLIIMIEKNHYGLTEDEGIDFEEQVRAIHSDHLYAIDILLNKNGEKIYDYSEFYNEYVLALE